MSEFEKLLADIEAVQEMHKSMPPKAGDDEGEEGNSKESGKDPADKKIDDAASEEESDGDGYGDDMMGKSMTVFDANGEPLEAVDGTAMIKSMLVRLETAETQLKGSNDMVKALQQTVTLMGQQAELIKSLQERVNVLSGEGKGRKSAVVIPSVKPDASSQMAKSMGGDQQNGVTSQEFMAKALMAQEQGIITGHDVMRAESHLNRGLGVPVDIVRRVASAK